MLVTLHNGKSVAAFVFRMTCVTFYPIELHFMFVQKRKELFPQVNIKGRFFIGFYPAFFLPAVDQPFVMLSTTYLLSVVRITRQGSLRAESPVITPRSSIRLLVVAESPPEISFSMPLYLRTTPKPPGPGLPLQAPSVNISTVLIITHP